jgi:hypothetical protein
MGDQRLPLEQRIGSLRDGDTTDHGTPIGSTPLAVQPPRRPDMREQDRSDHATNVTATDANITAVGDIVDDKTPHLLTPDDIVERLTMLFWSMKDEGRVQDKNTIADAIDEIQRLRAIITRQGMELLIAHSEALSLYDLTTLPAKEAT